MPEENYLYPDAETVLAIHSDIVEEGDDTEPGIQNADAVDSALTYISEGYFGQKPKTVHAKAAHLMRPQR